MLVVWKSNYFSQEKTSITALKYCSTQLARVFLRMRHVWGPGSVLERRQSPVGVFVELLLQLGAQHRGWPVLGGGWPAHPGHPIPQRRCQNIM